MKRETRQDGTEVIKISKTPKAATAKTESTKLRVRATEVIRVAKETAKKTVKSAKRTAYYAAETLRVKAEQVLRVLAPLSLADMRRRCLMRRFAK